MEDKTKNAGTKSESAAADAACPACGGRRTARGDAEKAALLNRLSRIEGQLRGIRAMVENDAYCPDILTQGAAAAAAIEAFDRALLLRHIETCVKRDLAAQKEGAAEELCALLKKMMR